MQLKRSLSTVLSSLLLSLTIAAQTIVFEGKVVRVIDGTTVVVVTQNKTEFQVKCHGSIAPESQEKLGPQSQQHLSDLLLGQKVSVEYLRRDDSGQLIGTIRLNGTDMCLEQIAEGLAWHNVKTSSEQNSSTRERYSAAEFAARNRRLGMWRAASSSTVNAPSRADSETSTHDVSATSSSPTTVTKATSSTGSTVDVSGYFKKDGTYVQPYKRTAPNSRVDDNWSTSGNVNPFTHSGNKSWLRRNWWIFPTVGALVGTGYLLYRYNGSGGGIVCNDGWVSHAENRQGACSHHGGIR